MTRQQGRIRKDSLEFLVANPSTAVTQAPTVILAARALSADEFGRHAIGRRVAALFTAAGDGGVGIVATRELTQVLVNPRKLVP